ncbi:4a-hydroxytetrahydrobiopterin dehydratase [Brevibacillus aydinogluensis]|jgi:4a-hydroxytetrahydrobiopterin dehydratase|uniref:4a-hydroxytetrahydrobiopterin dehydratase n=1 Tax=Brevibacillus aydinogluensis TaxID=927786 RepID=UPI000E374573|nr:4a-hydroxytetrahydrobiopterin dehydratase [Brevibacillus aydinogluensis]MDT3416522.1 4a-hydroxytetrahydrobiopterin dehydratase [Brevibacillus aydinogluensis]REK61485.1 MAG: 4a-hydroxytetrahydrobiopterin dehydratase [Brevibacillus sp.]
MTRLTLEQVKVYMNKVPGWRLVEDRMALARTYHCPDFASAVSFVNRVAEQLEHDSQHVEILISGGAVTFTLTTRDAKGLTGKDFALAQTISKVS